MAFIMPMWSTCSPVLASEIYFLMLGFIFLGMLPQILFLFTQFEVRRQKVIRLYGPHENVFLYLIDAKMMLAFGI